MRCRDHHDRRAQLCKAIGAVPESQLPAASCRIHKQERLALHMTHTTAQAGTHSPPMPMPKTSWLMAYMTTKPCTAVPCQPEFWHAGCLSA